jgi:hypothetical protein
MDNKITLQILSDYVVNNDLLEQVKLHVEAFNPLKILRMDHYEIRHSNVLAWLLDPKGNHHIRDDFFKRFVMEVLSRNDGENKNLHEKFNVTNIFLSSFHDLEVHREWNDGKHNEKVDVVLVSHEQEMAFIIENKVNAKEGEEQLVSYYNLVEAYYGYPTFPIFLTKDNEEPSDLRYLTFTHLGVLEVLEKLVPNKKDYMNQRVYEFTLDYMTLIKEITMTDYQYIDLCQELYSQHKAAIELLLSLKERTLAIDDTIGSKRILDLVGQYRDVSEYVKCYGEVNHFEEAFKKFIYSFDDITYSKDHYRHGNIGLFFYPKEYEAIKGFHHLTHQNWKCCPFPIPYIFDKYKGGISLKVEVAKFNSQSNDVRNEFLHFIHKRSGYNPNDKTNIRQLKKIKLPMTDEEWENESVIYSKMKSLYEEFITDKGQITKLIQEFWSGGF